MKKTVAASMFVSALMLLQIISPAASEPASANSANCAPPVSILAFRGSGEKWNADTQTWQSEPNTYASGQVTDGYEGGVLKSLFESYMYEANGQGLGAPDVASVPIIPVGPDFGGGGYPAVPVSGGGLTAAGWLMPIQHSAEAGAAAAVSYINNSIISNPDGCASPKFILAGYSQGAMAARMTAMQEVPYVLGTMFIGDPYQTPDRLGVSGTGHSGEGIFTFALRNGIGPVPPGVNMPEFYDAGMYTSTYCEAGDPMCIGTVSLEDTPVHIHSNYFQNASVTSGPGSDPYVQKGQELAKLVARSLDVARHQNRVVAATGSDVKYVFSMINLPSAAITSNYKTIVNSVEDASGRFYKPRYSLYVVTPDTPGAVLYQPFTNSKEEFLSALNAAYTQNLNRAPMNVVTTRSSLPQYNDPNYPANVSDYIVTQVAASGGWKEGAHRDIIYTGKWNNNATSSKDPYSKYGAAATLVVTQDAVPINGTGNLTMATPASNGTGVFLGTGLQGAVVNGKTGIQSKPSVTASFAGSLKNGTDATVVFRQSYAPVRSSAGQATIEAWDNGPYGFQTRVSDSVSSQAPAWSGQSEIAMQSLHLDFAEANLARTYFFQAQVYGANGFYMGRADIGLNCLPSSLTCAPGNVGVTFNNAPGIS